MVNIDAWSVSEHEFPHEGSTQDKLVFCIRYALLAPSIYNTQPWQFEVKGAECRLYADRRYALAVIDPDDRSLIIACSAALFNLRMAIRYFGYSEDVSFIPDVENEDLLATVKFGEKIESENDEDRDQDIFKVVTAFEKNHGAFLNKAVSQEDIDDFKTACSAEGAWLYVCDQNEKNRVINMVAEADRIQSMTKNFRRELCLWTDKRRVESNDGMPNYGMEFSAMMNQFTPHILRRFAGPDKEAVTDSGFAENVPLLAILGTVSGGAVERMMTGQALMRLCLLAQSKGLSISTLNQVCEVPEMRLRLHDEINQQGRAHIILRLGYGGKIKHTARRPLESVLKVNGIPYVVPPSEKAKVGSKRKFWPFK